jgi:hypothetical protein
MAQAIFPRELDAMDGGAHPENKGAGPVKRLIEAGARDVILGGKERKLQALKIQRDAHDFVAAGLTTGASWMLSRRQN